MVNLVSYFCTAYSVINCLTKSFYSHFCIAYSVINSLTELWHVVDLISYLCTAYSVINFNNKFLIYSKQWFASMAAHECMDPQSLLFSWDHSIPKKLLYMTWIYHQCMVQTCAIHIIEKPEKIDWKCKCRFYSLSHKI